MTGVPSFAQILAQKSVRRPGARLEITWKLRRAGKGGA